MADRMWCAVGAYPGRKRIIFGTVVARDRQAALEALVVKWHSIMPIDPPDLEPIPGQLVFRGDDDG